MVAILQSLNIFIKDYKFRIHVQMPKDNISDTASTAIQATVSMYSPSEYQSILPLKGKYSNDPFWETFPDFLEEYNRQINDLYKE